LVRRLANGGSVVVRDHPLPAPQQKPNVRQTRLEFVKTMRLGGDIAAWRRQSACDLHDDSLSTKRRQAGILWMFIRSSSGTLKLCNLSVLDPDPMDNLWKAHI
jgi:hypothetical protein